MLPPPGVPGSDTDVDSTWCPPCGVATCILDWSESCQCRRWPSASRILLCVGSAGFRMLYMPRAFPWFEAAGTARVSSRSLSGCTSW